MRVRVAALILAAATLLLFWPGYALYDSVQQFEQVRSGQFDDWHPPAMARLWQALHAATGAAGAPMFALQLLLYWLGIGLIADALAARGRGRAAAAMLAIGACPVFLGWQVAILKDAQMLGALIAATGIVAAHRLRGRAMGAATIAGVAMLIGYAALVRSNAAFAVAPLVVMLAAVPGRPRARAARHIVVTGTMAAGAMLALTGLMLALQPIINHRLLGARASDVAATLPLYDRAGIAHFGGTDALPPGIAPRVAAMRCYKPLFWDPLGDETRCGAMLTPLMHAPTAARTRAWVAAIVAHPLAYARHRAAHLNATERWWVAANWPFAEPPQGNEPNRIGLADPGRSARAAQAVGAWVVRSPLGWPIAYLVLALALAPAAWRGRGEAEGALALALIASALGLEASFALVSIASDLRYHLWPMLATAIAAVLLWRGRVPVPRAGLVALVLVIAVGTAARATLPAMPHDYAALIE